MAIARPVSKTVISTVGWGIPITDEVNRLTDALAALTPTPWTALTLKNGWVQVAGWQPAQYRKVGDNVQVRGYVQNGAANTPCATLPAGYRPPYSYLQTTNGYNGSARVLSTITVGSDGNLNLEVGTAVTDLTAWFSTI